MWNRNSEYCQQLEGQKTKLVKSPRAQFHSFLILANFYKTALSSVVSIGCPLPSNQVELPHPRIKDYSELDPFIVICRVFPPPPNSAVYSQWDQAPSQPPLPWPLPRGSFRPQGPLAPDSTSQTLTPQPHICLDLLSSYLSIRIQPQTWSLL